jgi:hypothetical protein
MTNSANQRALQKRQPRQNRFCSFLHLQKNGFARPRKLKRIVEEHSMVVNAECPMARHLESEKKP